MQPSCMGWKSGKNCLKQEKIEKFKVKPEQGYSIYQ